jgi:glycine hydroxymethyltransferase
MSGNTAMKENSTTCNSDFKKNLKESDPKLYQLVQEETKRQEYGLEMIPSENFVSEAVLEACGSVLTNKYAEGQPHKRYYGGCHVVDQVEDIAKQRACDLFGAEYCNVQPHSGAAANQAVYEALLQPGDTVMGMRLDMGGHLTHGSPVNFSGKHYKIVAYGVDSKTHLIDEQEVLALALEHKPKLIICGATAYSRKIDFAMFRKVADQVGALVLADISHYSGLVAAGEYPSPVPHCQIVSTTTHKTLRGPRSGIVMARKEHSKAIDKAIFPGLQGGPHMHTILAKAVAFGEAQRPEFKTYAKQIIANARALSAELQKHGFDIVSGGTDSHVMLVDLRPANINGKDAEAVLDSIGITCNKNTIPYDPESPFIGSGIRIGTPALTTRGFKEAQMSDVASFIKRAIEKRDCKKTLETLKNEVKELSVQFPLYSHRIV